MPSADPPLWQAVLFWLAEQSDTDTEPLTFLASPHGLGVMPAELATTLHWLITHDYVQPRGVWRHSPQLPATARLTQAGRESAHHLTHSPRRPH